MKILVTGAAGFIGQALTARLLKLGHDIVGIDNINSYYDPALKLERLALLGVDPQNVAWNKPVQGAPGFRFIRMNLEDYDSLSSLFQKENFDLVINLGAQAGVRYSIRNPRAYVSSNIDGFINILEGCRSTGVSHLIFASSSSVYGLNATVPFSEHHGADHPVSLYAATKKSNEMMAHAYASLYGLPVTGLRFFTVYGPWGRPDMSPWLFVDAILAGRPIKIFNNGDMLRDFTYIDDIVEAMSRLIDKVPAADPQWNAASPDPASSTAPFRIYNIGNQCPIRLLDYIETIEKIIGRPAVKEFLPMQPGDVYQTYADTSDLREAVGFTPSTSLEEGLRHTVSWFQSRLDTTLLK